MKDSLPQGWPLPDDYLIELGRISALWASLESLLNTCLGKLAGFNDLHDPTSFILVTHSSFPQRLDMLGALCDRLQEAAPNLSNHREAISKLKAAQTARNRFAHNGVSFDPQSKTFVLPQGSARGKLKTSVTAITTKDIRNVSREIHLATLALYKLVFERDVAPIWERGEDDVPELKT